MRKSPNTSIVILTGAGISKQSGLDTFRGDEGLWQGVRVEEVATPEAFRVNPDLVYSFYNIRREKLLDPSIKPNAAHKALARLEKEWAGEVTIITQNVDDLHERGGSENLLHMHGELLKAKCINCEAVMPWKEEMNTNSICPNCGKDHCLRVNVVWFGEMPHFMKEIERLLINCDLFVSIGTSGNVYPAAGFVQMANHYSGAKTVEINLEKSLNADEFSQGLYGAATDVVPLFVDRLISGKFN